MATLKYRSNGWQPWGTQQPAIILPTLTCAITPATNFTDFGSTYTSPRAARHGEAVFIEGLLRCTGAFSSTAGQSVTVATIVNPSMRPAADVILHCLAYTGSYRWGRLTVTAADGLIRFVCPDALSWVANYYVSIEGAYRGAPLGVGWFSSGGA